VSGQLRAPAALPPGKDPRQPWDRRLGGPQSRSGHCGEEKILHCRESNPTPARSLTLGRLSYPDSIYIISFVVLNTMLDVTELSVEYPLTSDTITRVDAGDFIAIDTWTEHSTHITHCGVFSAFKIQYYFHSFHYKRTV
jgi:hypothetical protein